MNRLARPLPRSRLGAAPMAAGGWAATGRRTGAAPWPPVWLLFGLLLPAVAAPAFAFDDERRSPQAIQELVLDSSGVPTSANWVVLDATGIAAWRARGETRWHRFTRGEVLPSGSEIETGADGEITLVVGGDQLTIAPQGRLIVPHAQPGQDRRLSHERGRILMQVESREARDVRVDTPLLSLGIKGTTFEVLVEPEQDSVLVHEGDVEVTTPSQADPVDLGAGEGLRQPAVPGSEATRFVVPKSAMPAGRADEPAWLLQPAEPDEPAEPETVALPAQPEPAETRVPADTARRGSSREEPWIDFGRLDELASSWGSVAIAVVGLLILTVPALALLQYLREQWLGRRPGPKGQRRRELVRG